MKILQLRFKNLNSLYGEWFIDFTAPEYAANGIFAITGPTGSGKSTILDAISLALFGMTPRLKKVAKGSNEIMSRKTGECFSEVVFESQKGCFRCHWSQRCARNSAAGNLQDPAHEISDAITGVVIENKKSQIAKVIEEKTGMDFLQFTRSIMLAQGGFSAFLQASASERASILEQITGTEVYSLISSRIFERQRAEENRLDNLNAEISGTRVLLPEEEFAIRQELSEKQTAENELSQKHSANSQALQWLTAIESLRGELVGIRASALEIDNQMVAFEPQRAKLELAGRAAELDADYTALSMTRQQQNTDSDSLREVEKNLPGLETAFKEHEQQLHASEKKTDELKALLLEQRPLLQNVRALDVQLAEKSRAIETAGVECRQVASQIEENALKQKQAGVEQKATTGELERIKSFLAANAADEALVSQFSAISELAGSLQPISEELEKRQKELEKEQKLAKKTEKDLKARDKERKALQTEHKDAQKEARQQEVSLSQLLAGKLLREYQFERNALLKEAGFIKTIAGYEEDRKKFLEDGKPCPLCGATAHPYAIGNIPELDDNQKRTAELDLLIDSAEALEAQIKVRQTDEHELAKKLLVAESRFSQAEQAVENAKKAIVEKQSLVGDAEKKSETARATILSKLKGHGINDIPDNDMSVLLSALRARLQSWQEHQAKKVAVENSLQQISSQLNSLTGIAATLKDSLAARNTVIADQQQVQKQLQAERHALFAAKNPDDEEKALEKQITQAEKAGQQLSAALDKSRASLNEARTLIRQLQENIGTRSRELASLENGFVLNLGRKGFADETVFASCRLSAEHRQTLAQQAQELDSRKAETATRLRDREALLEREQQLNLTSASADELKTVLAEQSANIKLLGEQMGGLKQMLADNSKALALISSRKADIDKQNRECQKWDRLNALIGSKDGHKFSRFAQGLTFGIIVNHANRQLEKMTGRYLLTRDPEELLELKVVDKYQAGEVRSTKNLSGGESFIVSLALALGLSKMASKKVRVDSLFLDEGFGTLDDDALQVALDTLAGLQQDGKLIGVISHVAMLKERISTQITVSGSNTGRSTIEGPGIKRK